MTDTKKPAPTLFSNASVMASRWLHARMDNKQWLKEAGHFRLYKQPEKEVSKRLRGIPEDYHNEAYAIIHMCQNLYYFGHPFDLYGCLKIRCALWALQDDLYRKDKLMLKWESYWSLDGPFIDPAELVALTNGLIGWQGDLSCRDCKGGLEHVCPYMLTEEQMVDLEANHKKNIWKIRWQYWMMKFHRWFQDPKRNKITIHDIQWTIHHKI